MLVQIVRRAEAKEEVWSTKVTKEDLKNAVEDEFGVKYSKEWKRLLKAPHGLKDEYSIRKGVKVIGNGAFGVVGHSPKSISRIV